MKKLENSEIIMNIFPICYNGIITHLGYRAHKCKGSDNEKFQYLLDRVVEDFKVCNFVQVSSGFEVVESLKKTIGITFSDYKASLPFGCFGLFNQIYSMVKAPDLPLCVYTNIIDGILINEHDHLI